MSVAHGNGNGSKTVPAHRAEAVVGADGSIRLQNVPFASGTRVEVLVVEGREPHPASEGSLHGSILRDVNPFGPAVPPEEWEAIR